MARPSGRTVGRRQHKADPEQHPPYEAAVEPHRLVGVDGRCRQHVRAQSLLLLVGPADAADKVLLEPPEVRIRPPLVPELQFGMLGIEHAFLFGDDRPLFLERLDAALRERPPLVLGLGPVQLRERLGRSASSWSSWASRVATLARPTAIASTQTRWRSASSAPITLATCGSSCTARQRPLRR